MDGLPPPAPPAVHATTCIPGLSQDQADQVLANISRALPGTAFTAAWPSCVPGLVSLQMRDGSVAYTDKNARYLVLGLVFDTSTGKALDRQMDGLKE